MTGHVVAVKILNREAVSYEFFSICPPVSTKIRNKAIYKILFRVIIYYTCKPAARPPESLKGTDRGGRMNLLVRCAP